MSSQRNADAKHGYRVGQDNVQVLGLDVHNPVFVIAAVVVVVFVAFTLALPDRAASVFGTLRPWLTTNLDWVFVGASNFFVLFCLALIVSPWGRVRIGGPDARPEYSYPSWFAMLFAAGMGIGVMFYGVFEPVQHTLSPPLGYDPADIAMAREIGMAATINHWALHPWAIYAVVGLAISIFCYNKGLPLTIRSAFYPLLGRHTWGWAGHIIDILAVFATVFGLATSLGYGAEQASAGLTYLFDLPEGAGINVMLICAVTAVALFSVMRGLDGGVKLLSEINMVMALLLFLFVLFMVSTTELLLASASNAVDYIKHLPALSNWIGREDTDYFHGWTTFYWSWWIAWSPFVGMFIARVSKGRTVREFLACALLAPSTVCILWMTVFGGSALDQYLDAGYTGVTEVVKEFKPELAMFKFLEVLPLAGITSMVAIVLVLVFFITSMDSGSLVLDTITAGGKVEGPMVQRIFWCTFSGLVAIALLVGGGLASLQAASLSVGFPFCIIIVVMCFSILKGLRSEYQRMNEHSAS